MSARYNPQPEILEHFRESARKYRGELPTMTFWRIMNGRVGKLLYWIVSDPELTAALHRDALAYQERERTARHPDHPLTRPISGL